MRKIFVGGLRDDNVKAPPYLTNLFMFNLTGEDGGAKEVHLYEPDNIVIAEISWLRENWHKVEKWIKEEKDTNHFEDIHLFEQNNNIVRISPQNEGFTEYQKSLNEMPRCEISKEDVYEIYNKGFTYYGPYQCGRPSLTSCQKCGVNVCYYHSTHENICARCNV